MATFTPTVRTNKEYNAVYIRISHNSKADYIKTEMILHKSGVRKGKITNAEILANCALKIKEYIAKVNSVNISSWTIQELKEFLTSEYTDISFTHFANERINKMYNEGRRAYQNYKIALTNLQRHVGKEEINFNELTSKVIQGWVDSMSDSVRKKSLYPTCVKAIFNAALREYNDYDYNVIRIRTNPFARVKIPKERITEKRSVDVELLNKLFTSEVVFPDNRFGISSREEFAKDVAMMIFCLAGINAADLYDLKKTSLKKDWKMHLVRVVRNF